MNTNEVLEAEKQPEKKNTWKEELISWIQVLASAAAIAFVLTTFIIANSEVPSAAHTVPPLTTVARDFDEYAKTAVKMVEMIRQGIYPGIIRVPSYIVERESVKDLCQK